MTQSAVLATGASTPPAVQPAGPRQSWLARHPAWPVTILLVGIPLWWALGLVDYIFTLLAIPMAARLYAWGARGNRRIRMPPGFGLWLLFLLCVLVGAATLSLTAPGTVASPVSNRVISFAVRAGAYLGVTVLLLFVGNLTERELPRQRLAWLLGLVALYAVAGGLGGVLAGNLHFTSPLAHLIPNRLQSNNLVLKAELHPALSQIQSVLGTARGRPSAPFVYTNEWGNCLALLLPWLVARWWFQGTGRQRLIAAAGLVIMVIPVVYSLDRGLWIGLLVAIAYLGVRLAARGRLAVLGVVLGALAVAAVLIFASPLQAIISQRLANGHSDARRGSLAVAAVVAARSSPLVGYGGTRHQQGSVQSVSVGRKANCPSCGNATIGGNGQFWMLLICDGFLGAALYVGFFAFGVWRYWRDRTAYGMAGVLVLLLTFVFMFAYTAIGAPLGFTMLAYAMLWRNERARRLAAPAAPRAAGRWANGPLPALMPRAGR
jgi:polysaccharide biosynthesis protein PslJ